MQNLTQIIVVYFEETEELVTMGLIKATPKYTSGDTQNTLTDLYLTM
jgi:hypothetical protein